ncbi:1291_t:CDS:2 [Diversispora eburnea]|uniref:1291_t:CDS:1 n=1 Tax=Diversispora eburnea TaxID=1213867 RepID=A0A9N9AFF1_9GLOM|nr:1291_t:CDS:2 [Diversispora eburnea]
MGIKVYNIDLSLISPKLAHKTLKNKDISKSYDWGDLIKLLKFFVKDEDYSQLEDIDILPLANKEFAKFGNHATTKERTLLPSVEDRHFVNDICNSVQILKEILLPINSKIKQIIRIFQKYERELVDILCKFGHKFTLRRSTKISKNYIIEQKPGNVIKLIDEARTKKNKSILKSSNFREIEEWISNKRVIPQRFEKNLKYARDLSIDEDSQNRRSRISKNVLYDNFDNLQFSESEWNNLISIRFVPASNIDRLYSEIIPPKLNNVKFECFKSLCLPKYKSIAWTQVAFLDGSVIPNQNSSILKKEKFGTPNSACEDKVQELRECDFDTKERIFLNMDQNENPYDTRNWVTASELILNVSRKEDGFVKASLSKYESLLKTAGSGKSQENILGITNSEIDILRDESNSDDFSNDSNDDYYDIKILKDKLEAKLMNYVKLINAEEIRDYADKCQAKIIQTNTDIALTIKLVQLTQVPG